MTDPLHNKGVKIAQFSPQSLNVVRIVCRDGFAELTWGSPVGPVVIPRHHSVLIAGVTDVWREAPPQSVPDPKPIDMVLHCPMCHTQHIDAPEFNSTRNDPHPSSTGEDDPALSWTNPPHRSHLCYTCGYVWRPADVATNGVKAVKTKGRHDSAIPEPATFSVVGIKDLPEKVTGGWARITPESPAVGLKLEVQQYGRAPRLAIRRAGALHEGGFFDLATGLKMRPQPTRWRLPA